MGKKRTSPDAVQARYLYDYFKDFIMSFDRYMNVMTDEQRNLAYSDLKRIQRFSENLGDELLAWSEKHITSKVYSNAIRAVNKRLGRTRDNSKSARSRIKTTVEISKHNRDRLQDIKQANNLPSLDDTIAMLIDLERKIKLGE